MSKIPNNENKPICAECGGGCCKTIPGAAFPDDFNYPEDKDMLRQALASGFWCLDYLGDDDAPQYYVRPATKEGKGKLIAVDWYGGECSLLSELGCSLDFKNRPRECRVAVPKINKYAQCKFGDPHVHGCHAAVKDWKPFVGDLLKMVEELEADALQ